MIDLNPESVRSVIDHAREFQVEASMEAEAEPESLADYLAEGLSMHGYDD